MLIEFSVTNFLSFKDKNTFSMVASSDKELLNNVMEVGGERLLRTTALYGANASGKTNLFKIIAIVGSIIKGSNYRTPNMAMPISPFKLSEDTSDKPSEFEIKFIYDGIRYVYLSDAHKSGYQIQVFDESYNDFIAKVIVTSH